MSRPISASMFLGGIALAVASMLHSGPFGWTLFPLLPGEIGALGAWYIRASTPWTAGLAGAMAAILASCSLLLFGAEGLMGIVMCLPWTIPFGALGGYLWYRLSRGQIPRTTAMLLLLPFGTLGFDLTAHPPIFEVHTTIEIAAPPEKV